MGARGFLTPCPSGLNSKTQTKKGNMESEITKDKVIITMTHEEAMNMLEVSSSGYRKCEERMWETQKQKLHIAQDWKNSYSAGKEFFNKISVVSNFS